MGLGPTARDYLVSAIGEFVGTYLFLFFAFAAAQTANQPNGTVPLTANATNTSVLLYIALGFGASLAANVWIFFRVSGGQFNPAVTFALVLIGAVPPVKAALLIPIQLLAGTFAALSARAVIPGNDILFAVSLGPGVTPGRFCPSPSYGPSLTYAMKSPGPLHRNASNIYAHHYNSHACR